MSGVAGNGATNPLIGNGICNDETNNPGCNYDSSDCCLYQTHKIDDPGELVQKQQVKKNTIETLLFRSMAI